MICVTKFALEIPLPLVFYLFPPDEFKVDLFLEIGHELRAESLSKRLTGDETQEHISEISLRSEICQL